MNTLQGYEPAQIARITDIKEAVHVRDMADAAAIFYKAQDAWEEAQKAQEMRLRAIRAAGTILLPPGQGGQTPREKPGPNSRDRDTDYLQLLDDAGISHGTAQTWMKVARVPDGTFEAYFSEAEYWQDDFSIAGLMRYAGEWYGRSDIAEWETPDWLFDLLDDEFHFTLDVCANEDNAKCTLYFSPDDDGLSREWEGVCWMNPPYGRLISAWVEKARQSAVDGALVVCLVPARTDTNWWWNSCIEGEIRFIKGRVEFVGADSGAPFPSAVVVLRPGLKGAKVVWWNVGKE